jgi:nucleotide-binding universal stress UspA family protein
MASAGTTTRGAVVVGVTAPGRETAAMKFAADCAAREGAEVVLVHAYGAAVPPPPPSVLMSYAAAADVAEWVVKGVEEEFAGLTRGAVEFRSMAAVGTPAHALVDLGKEARMVVVQHRDVHWLGRLFVGSTVNGVAAHGACPVVSVPHGWEPGRPGEVVVGVHEAGAPREAVVAGLEWAAAIGAPVRVVHAWRLDPAYDDIITARVAADWANQEVRVLESAISDLRGAHPSVAVVTEVRHQWPSQVLVDASDDASMVVVGRHAGHWRGGPHLGSVARTVLREAACPVMVVPLTPQ